DTAHDQRTFAPKPVWTETTPVGGMHVNTYWLFYGYNDAPLDAGLFGHEGDWEHLNVSLDNTLLVPRVIGYFAHNSGADVQFFSEVERTDWFHPVAHAAKGSHASYPQAGIHPL